ncbi:enoyl-CoA hydratase [Nocardiopsis gilva YIM 90087]|uniref:Enoyl-CoA hydratase n=1 Tax=Nocardiopsis gilva YIM 90087 TaxID=1235441 RepID=A0A223SBD6_9ACTN|nr:crotonase/enoyl-CoA hydratase family protein [Nocardiopsis gilva]ASU85405.1 enoyl-CoA hydratase [Nocardiopsis gilva YIM 90087]
MAELLHVSTPHCHVIKDGSIVTVTMHRPEARNALSTDMLVGLADAFGYIDSEPQVRVGILTGADGAFCSGADLKAMGTPSEDPRVRRRAAEIEDFHWKGLLRQARPSKPLVAAVEGPAVAGGTELVAGTDIRIAARGATFGLYEARRGLFPMGGCAVRLARQIPYTHAMDMLLTGRSYTAREAADIGLVTRVVPDGAAMDAARTAAEAIAACGPLAVQAILRVHRETEGMAEEEALRVSDRVGWQVMASDDAKEGARAFAEKRAARFTGT